MPWVIWDSLAMPKLLGGWGLKNIQKIPIALAAKKRWRMIQSDNLWLKVVTQKYINTDSVVEWIRRSTQFPKWLYQVEGPCQIFSGY